MLEKYPESYEEVRSKKNIKYKGDKQMKIYELTITMETEWKYETVADWVDVWYEEDLEDGRYVRYKEKEWKEWEERIIEFTDEEITILGKLNEIIYDVFDNIGIELKNDRYFEYETSDTIFDTEETSITYNFECSNEFDTYIIREKFFKEIENMELEEGTAIGIDIEIYGYFADFIDDNGFDKEETSFIYEFETNSNITKYNQ